MNWLCVSKFATLLSASVALAFVVGIISYGLGMRRANRAYWKMMHRAGSKITRDW